MKRPKAQSSSRRKSTPGRTQLSVQVRLGKRSYPIVIGSGVVQKIGKLFSNAPSKRAFIIADERLQEARDSLLAGLSSAGWETHEIPVQAGETLKDFTQLYPLYGELLNRKANRDSVLFALGGGSVGDAAGFLASTYLRGIAWVGVPTTLLAQVDSAIGGKTAVNHAAGKNLIGTFHQPSLVVCDTDFLKTLSARELVSGLGEIVKYALTYDPKFLARLEKELPLLLNQDPAALSRAIQTSVQWKAKAVSKDEFDQKGIREVLNFGHTFGHALESLTRYEKYQHGEAVIWGMRFALALSQVRNKLAPAKRVRLDAILSKLDVPSLPDSFGPDRFLEVMTKDKKVRSGKIHFVLLKDVGKTLSDNQVTSEDIARAFTLLKGAES
jgi:3-dehydroquinate synthase